MGGGGWNDVYRAGIESDPAHEGALVFRLDRKERMDGFNVRRNRSVLCILHCTK